MLACATDWKVIRAKLANVAAIYGVHPNTVKNWTRQALKFQGRDGDRLRALIKAARDLHAYDAADDDDRDGEPGGGDPSDD